jgi:hypothetical protein
MVEIDYSPAWLTNNFLKLDCSNDPLTAPLDLPELYNSAGSLKIMPDVQGNVDLFGDTDVANDVDGKIFTVNRRAAEGDTTLSLYVDSNRWANIGANWDIKIHSDVASGEIQLGTVNTNVVRLLGDVNSIGLRSSGTGTENLPLRHYGYITAGGLSGQKYVQWQLDDTDDYFHLTRQSDSVLGFKVDMPFIVGDGTNYTNINTTGDISLMGTAGIVLPHLMQSDTTDQSISSAVEEQIITFNTDNHHNGITRTSSSRFTVLKESSYLITFSAVVQSAVAGKQLVIWLKINGNNVTNSATYYTFKSANATTVVTVTFIEHFDANDYFELWMYGNDTGIKLDSTAAVADSPGVTPAIPVCPGIILTCNYCGKD